MVWYANEEPKATAFLITGLLDYRLSASGLSHLRGLWPWRVPWLKIVRICPPRVLSLAAAFLALAIPTNSRQGRTTEQAATHKNLRTKLKSKTYLPRFQTCSSTLSRLTRKGCKFGRKACVPSGFHLWFLLRLLQVCKLFSTDASRLPPRSLSKVSMRPSAVPSSRVPSKVPL